MFRNLFDFSDDDFLFSVSDHMAMDSDGDMMMRVGNKMAMDMDTGEIHFTQSWNYDDKNNW